jgi:hypothetical protein
VVVKKERKKERKKEIDLYAQKPDPSNDGVLVKNLKKGKFTLSRAV